MLPYWSTASAKNSNTVFSQLASSVARFEWNWWSYCVCECHLESFYCLFQCGRRLYSSRCMWQKVGAQKLEEFKKWRLEPGSLCHMCIVLRWRFICNSTQSAQWAQALNTSMSASKSSENCIYVISPCFVTVSRWTWVSLQSVSIFIYQIFTHIGSQVIVGASTTFRLYAVEHFVRQFTALTTQLGSFNPLRHCHSGSFSRPITIDWLTVNVCAFEATVSRAGDWGELLFNLPRFTIRTTWRGDVVNIMFP